MTENTAKDTVELSTNKTQAADFWQAMEFSEEKVDLLVDALKGKSQALRSDLINEINQTVEDIATGKTSRKNGKIWLDELFEDKLLSRTR